MKISTASQDYLQTSTQRSFPERGVFDEVLHREDASGGSPLVRLREPRGLDLKLTYLAICSGSIALSIVAGCLVVPGVALAEPGVGPNRRLRLI